MQDRSLDARRAPTAAGRLSMSSLEILRSRTATPRELGTPGGWRGGTVTNLGGRRDGGNSTSAKKDWKASDGEEEDSKVLEPPGRHPSHGTSSVGSGATWTLPRRAYLTALPKLSRPSAMRRSRRMSSLGRGTRSGRPSCSRSSTDSSARLPPPLVPSSRPRRERSNVREEIRA